MKQPENCRWCGGPVEQHRSVCDSCADEDLREHYNERAGILEHDAGLPVSTAEHNAWKEASMRWRRRGIWGGLTG